MLGVLGILSSANEVFCVLMLFTFKQTLKSSVTNRCLRVNVILSDSSQTI